MRSHLIKFFIWILLPSALSVGIWSATHFTSDAEGAGNFDKLIYTVDSSGSFTIRRHLQHRVTDGNDVRTLQLMRKLFRVSESKVSVLEISAVSADGIQKTGTITHTSDVSEIARAKGYDAEIITSLPTVAIGDLVTYITEQTHDVVIPREFSTEVHFDRSHAAWNTTVTFVVPAAIKIRGEADGFLPIDSPPGVWAWRLLADRPASVSPSSERDTASLYVSSIESDGAIARFFSANSLDAAESTAEVRELANNIATASSSIEQARQLYNYVNQHIAATPTPFAASGIVPENAGKTLRLRVGDCKAHVALLIALLRSKGIAAVPALLNNEIGRQTPGIPVFPGAFNHVIVYLPQFHVFADSTSHNAPFGVIPINDQGKKVVVVLGNDVEYLTTPVSGPSSDTEESITHITMNVDGSAVGETLIRTSGVLQLLSRRELGDLSVGADQAVSKLFKLLNMDVSGSMRFGDPNDLSTTSELGVSFKSSSWIDTATDSKAHLIGLPWVTSLVGVEREQRLSPDKALALCVGSTRHETVEFHVPSTVKPSALPIGVEVKNSVGSYTSRYNAFRQAIRVDRLLAINPGVICDATSLASINDLSRAVRNDLLAGVTFVPKGSKPGNVERR